MRVPFWMVFGLLISILIMDITSVWMVRSKIVEAMDHSLDAALVGGIIEDDRSYGGLFIDEDKGNSLARTYFKQTMNLNDNLENYFLKDTKLEIEYIQKEERPKVVGNVSTIIKAMSPKIFGLEGIPITIRKTMYHIEKYK